MIWALGTCYFARNELEYINFFVICWLLTAVIQAYFFIRIKGWASYGVQGLLRRRLTLTDFKRWAL